MELEEYYNHLQTVLGFLAKRETPPSATLEEVYKGIDLPKFPSYTESLLFNMVDDGYVNRYQSQTTRFDKGFTEGTLINITYYVIKPSGMIFYLKGGYKKEYVKHLDEIKRQNAKDKKLELDITLNEKVINDYPLTKILAWIGAIAGLFAAIAEVVKLLNK